MFIVAAAGLSLMLLTFRTALLPDEGEADVLPLTSIQKRVTIDKCFLYDRPMRTGSTTITNALRACIKSRPAWNLAKRVKEGQFDQAITRALEERAPNTVIMQHMWISDADVRLLHEKCGKLIYISSCAKLSDQVWSAAKMMSNVRKNGNSSLDDGKTQAALDWLDGNARDYMKMYEYYPHIRTPAPLEKQEDGRFPDVPPSFEKAAISLPFEPDYVLRKDFLQEDLTALLGAMQCGSKYSSMNVHAVSDADAAAEVSLMEKVREVSHAGDGDSYTRLMRIGQQKNDASLQKIRDFMSDQ